MTSGVDVRQNVNAMTGERVHAAMWKQKRTQKQLGALLGIDQGSVSNRLRGKTNWQMFEVLAVAAWLGVPVIQLMPEIEIGPVGPDDDPQGAPSRARTEDLRIIRSDVSLLAAA